MRELTAKQKKMLDGYIVKYNFAGSPLHSVYDLTSEHYEELQAVNDTEVLWQNVNRYITDKAFESSHKSSFWGTH